MKNYGNQTKNSPEPWWASLAGALYFLLAGLGLMLFEIPHAWDAPTGLRTFDWLFLFGLLVPAIGFAAGWSPGFPRWSYPYAGGLLVYSLYLMNTATPLLRLLGYENQGWGWRAWVPFLLACAVGFLLSWWTDLLPSPAGRGGESEDLVRRGEGLSSHFRFFSNIRQDWTLATYAMFGWMPLLLFISFDEMDRLYTLVFMLIFTILMVATALLYQRARRQETRVTVLAVGVFVNILLIEIGTIAYWLPVDGVNIPLSLLYGVIILGIMLSPALFMHKAKPVQRVGGV